MMRRERERLGLGPSPLPLPFVLTMTSSVCLLGGQHEEETRRRWPPLCPTTQGNGWG